MGWIPRKIEQKLKDKLEREYDSTKAEEFYAHYISARKKLVDNVLSEIKAIENNLTDHSEDHIGEVLDNVYYLLGEEVDGLHAMELYFLCMIVLFHDVGNIHGRTNHFDVSVIRGIYNYVRNEDPTFNDERRLVCDAASAHSGKASDGSSDTIRELRETEEGLYGIGINLRKLAPVLRFADELAEGLNRTSNYMILNGKYDLSSEKFHMYARATSIFIDRGNGRVVIRYTFDLKSNANGEINEEEITNVENLLAYCYERIIKLNEERRYNKYYSNLLGPFQRTEANFEFTVDGVLCDIGLKDLIITDLRVPGDSTKSIPDMYEDFKISKIIGSIKEKSLKLKQNE